MSYSGDPGSSNKDAVRFLVGDNKAIELVSDEEIEFVLSTEANIWMAAALISQQMVGKLGGVASKSVGGLSISWSTAEIKENIAKFKARGSGHMVPMAADIAQLFKIGQFDIPGTSEEIAE